MDRKKLVSESIDYIIQHLEEELSLDTVAAHFLYQNSISAGSSGKKPGKLSIPFIKRCRVDQSAVDMKLNPTKAITDIGFGLRVQLF